MPYAFVEHCVNAQGIDLDCLEHMMSIAEVSVLEALIFDFQARGELREILLGLVNCGELYCNSERDNMKGIVIRSGIGRQYRSRDGFQSLDGNCELI